MKEFQTIGDVEEAPPVKTNGRSKSALYNPLVISKSPETTNRNNKIDIDYVSNLTDPSYRMNKTPTSSNVSNQLVFFSTPSGTEKSFDMIERNK